MPQQPTRWAPGGDFSTLQIAPGRRFSDVAVRTSTTTSAIKPTLREAQGELMRTHVAQGKRLYDVATRKWNSAMTTTISKWIGKGAPLPLILVSTVRSEPQRAYELCAAFNHISTP